MDRAEAEAEGSAAAVPEVKDSAPPDPADPFSYNSTTSPADVPRALLPNFAELVRSGDLHHQLHGTMMVRKLLSVESPPLSDVIAADLGPSFVEFLGRDEQPPLQAEAAGVLATIAAGHGEHVQHLFRINAALGLIQLLRSPDANCRGNAASAVGNLAVENAEGRDYLLHLGAVEALLSVLDEPSNVSFVPRNAAWALYTLCRGKPLPSLEALAVAIPPLVRLLNHDDEEVVKGAAWALSYLSDGSTDMDGCERRVARILADVPLPRLVQLLDSKTGKQAGTEHHIRAQTLTTAAGAMIILRLVDSTAPLLLPIIRTLSNLVMGDEHQTQAVLDAGVLQRFGGLLDHPDRRVRREVCFALSNILAGTAGQIQSVIDECLLPTLLQRCFHASEAEVKNEAVWAVANCTTGGTASQIQYLVEIGVLDALQRKLFGASSSKVLALALKAITNVLAQGEKRRQEADLDWNPLWVRINAEALARQLETLQSHESDKVVHLAANLLVEYLYERNSDDFQAD